MIRDGGAGVGRYSFLSWMWRSEGEEPTGDVLWDFSWYRVVVPSHRRGVYFYRDLDGGRYFQDLFRDNGGGLWKGVGVGNSFHYMPHPSR